MFVDQGKFSDAQLDQIKGLTPRVKLSIALALQAKHRVPIDFRSLPHRKDRKDYPDGQKLYTFLSKLGRTFVTTNYDEWLDDELLPAPTDLTGDGDPRSELTPRPRTVYYKLEEFTAFNLSQQDVGIHLHGSVKSPDGMILTTPHYVRHYANDRRSANEVLFA